MGKESLDNNNNQAVYNVCNTQSSSFSLIFLKKRFDNDKQRSEYVMDQLINSR